MTNNTTSDSSVQVKSFQHFEDVNYIVVSAHSDNSPPVNFVSPIDTGFVDLDYGLELILADQEKYSVYTSGFQDNPDHLWKIVDHAFCEAYKPAKNHIETKYIVLYYEPVNISAVIRDCLPHLLEMEEGEEGLLVVKPGREEHFKAALKSIGVES